MGNDEASRQYWQMVNQIIQNQGNQPQTPAASNMFQQQVQPSSDLRSVIKSGNRDVRVMNDGVQALRKGRDINLNE